jgi:homoserine O-acetyltransferase
LKQHFIHPEPIALELGGVLPQVEIAYHVYGTPAADGSNVVWVCHALTANSDPLDWWPGLFGASKLFNPDEWCIVCANILGSCYGSSGPLTIDPSTGRPFYSTFPEVTIRDMVRAHQLLQKHLGIERVAVGIGGSMGAYQLLEWAAIDPKFFGKLCVLVTGARESAWGIGIHTAQRMAIETDPTWMEDHPDAGANGLRTARAIGMLTYRNYETFVQQQSTLDERTRDHPASSYLQYQGEKLVKRFNAQSYHLLTRAMDSHNLARGRGTMEDVLHGIEVDTLVIGISSDILCPVAEQKQLANGLRNGRYVEIDSPFGHDGFLVEGEKIAAQLRGFL